ncbi:MAG TPA: PEP-CTERM sorting domain-containing protein [Bryobacteraceae bacterium]|nr:PEP-CTERM sorting domain-containing protein [Bryobacteraceae bacterium]
MRRIILSSILLASLATAGTINLTPINDGRGTIGTAANFQVVSGTITTNSTGFADIVLDFNYHPVGSGGPSTPLGQWTLGGVNLDVGDLLFQVGSDTFGIPLASHSGSPNGANPALFANVTAGHFYQSSTELIANTVLNSPGFNFRPNADVWLGGTVNDLGTLTESITFNSGQTPSYVVEFTGQLPASFLADVNANGGLVSADFASATCGNGLLTGNGNLGSVPEPASLLLAGGGLLALGLLTRYRGRKTARQ